ncbi:MAG: electron transfer flavoprotein subunit alpha/FixB family protein [Enterocloster asparagiformis]|nr:electron transfer flavoprotein subunit alpha/FixB family protein [Enterocloster asparagiformis]
MGKIAWLIVGDFGHICGMVSAARKAADVVRMVVIGSGQLAQAAASSSPDSLYWFDTGEKIPVEALAGEAVALIMQEKPEFLLCLDDPISRVVWAKAAAAVSAAAVGTFFDITCSGEVKQARRLVAEGKSVEIVETENVLAGIFDGDDAEADGPVAAINRIDVGEPDTAMKFAAQGSQTSFKKEGLKSAKRVVGVGYGVGSKAELEQVKEFARHLEAEVGCSLPVAKQLHWFEEDRVVGITHNRIAPELYIALGISGQPQHMSGVRDAKVVVGINNDPEAAIFRKCDYGIVGDVGKLLPILLEKAGNL